MAGVLLREAVREVAGVPAGVLLRGVPDRADALRGVLEKVFAAHADLATSRWRKGRPHRLRHAGLDCEQLWAVLQLWDQPVLEWAEGVVEALAGTHFTMRHGGGAEGAQEEEEEDGEGEGEDEDEEDGGDWDDEEEEEEEEAEDEENENNGRRSKPKVADATTMADPLLDDEHFHVGEMDAFAEEIEQRVEKEYLKEERRMQREAERKLEGGGSSEDDEDDDDDDSYNSRGWGGGKSDDDEDEDEARAEEEMAVVKRSLYSAAADDADEDDEDDDQEDYEDDGNLTYKDFFLPQTHQAPTGTTATTNYSKDKTPAPTTKRERAKAELRAKIAALEDEALADKTWELRGEAKASSRPVDSLLEKGDLDVSIAKRLTPSLIPEVAHEIEALIRKRVEDGKFDDAQKKQPADAGKGVGEFRDVLSNERSKLGLADTYAKEFEERVLDHTPKERAELEKEHAEVQDMFDGLMQKLDALSNFHYTPKPPPASAGAGGVNRPPDVAAIHMEDVLPVTETGGNVSQVAPEEVVAKSKGLGKSREEMDSEERRAARRQVKAAKRKRRRADGEVPETYNAKKKAKKASKDEKEERQGGESDTMDWTSSAKVFRRMEAERNEDE